MTFRTVSIGFSTALLALACGSNDSNNDGDNAEDVGTTPVEVPVVTPVETPVVAAPGGGAVTPPVNNTPSGGNGDAADLARAAAENVLKTDCGDCHGSQLTPETAQKGMNYIDNTDELVKQGKLIPLDADNSLVIKRMRDGSMPPTQSGKPKATQADIDAVVQYIENPVFWPDYAVGGANCSDQEFDYDELYDEVSNDLRSADADDALTFRYITLTNRFNAGVCADTSLDRERQSLSKMVNMLSVNARVTPPLPINADETIFRIDLKDYDWDRAISVDGVAFTDVWEAIIAANPYAVEFEGDQADDAKLDSNTTVPVMNADSMVDVATVGNLYYAIIDVDVNDTLANFVLNDLGIDVLQNQQDEEQVRAGTTKSKLSKQDRVIQRDDIEIRAGALWQSFDFLADDQNDSIFEAPFDFAPGGTEAIFTLPNGLFGYIIADENDAIVEDSDILLDSAQGNNRALTSVSCSSCHASGLIEVTDEVREISLANRINFDLDADEVSQLENIYVSPEEFARIVEDDTADFYQRALDDADVPVNGVDPVSFTFLRFDADVDLTTAAGDLGVTAEVLDDNVNELDPSLGVLRRGTIDRDDFTAVYVDALCKLNVSLENAPAVAVCDQAAADLAAQ